MFISSVKVKWRHTVSCKGASSAVTSSETVAPHGVVSMSKVMFQIPPVRLEMAWMVWILLASTLFFKGMSNVLTPSLLSSTNSSEATESVVGKVMAWPVYTPSCFLAIGIFSLMLSPSASPLKRIFSGDPVKATDFTVTSLPIPLSSISMRPTRRCRAALLLLSFPTVRVSIPLKILPALKTLPSDSSRERVISSNFLSSWIPLIKSDLMLER